MNVNMGIGDLDYLIDFLLRMWPILVPLMLVGLGLMVAGIISVVKKPNPWGEKIIWLVIIIFLDIIGPVLYFALGSGMLDEKYAKEQDLREQQRSDDARGGL